MVKIPTKPRKSKIATPPKNVSTYKATKKSEKLKTKGVSKPKVTHSANKRLDTEIPCSSKQAAGTGLSYGTACSGGGGNNCKTENKILTWATANCLPINNNNEAIINNKEQLLMNATNSAPPNQLTASSGAAAATATAAPASPTTQQLTATIVNVVERVAAATVTTNATGIATATDTDTETQSKFRSGIRYSDVLRSKNVSSSGSVKPILASALPPNTQLLLNANSQTNDVKDIDLTLFPELGQHRNCPSSNNGSTSVRLLQRTQTNGDEDSPQAALDRLGGNDNHHSHHHSNNSSLSNSNSTDTAATASNPDNNHDEPEHAPPTSCPQCALNSLWVQHALFNSAQPYHMEIPEFNFLRGDQNYPRFLGQFEDENYLKTENLALLGLKLALGGNFHSMHSNSGR